MSAPTLVALGLSTIIGLLILWSIVREVDVSVGTASIERAKLLKKWAIWTDRYDISLRLVVHFYAKVSIGGKIYTVRMSEDAFEHVQPGDTVNVKLVTGRSGHVYALKATAITQ